MKVSMFVDKPLPSERPTGIGVAAFNMALALSRREITVRYVCRGGKDGAFSWNDHLTIQTIANYSRGNLGAARNLLRNEEFDVVHVHSSAALPSLILARALGKAVVMHSHGDEPLHPIRLALMRKVGMSLSQRVIAASNSNRDELIRNQRLSPGKISVVYNGVSTEAFKPSGGSAYVRPRYGLEVGGKIIFSIGTVQGRKGQSKIIQCLPEILQRWPNLTYVNVGRAYDPSYQDRLIKEAERLGVARRIRLLEEVPQDDLVALINSADVCVHAALREGFGLAVVEEMACGRPVVTFDIPTMAEIIESDVDGIRVQPNNREDLTKSILKLLEDPHLSRKLGDAARAKVIAKFTWDRAASRLEALYGELL
ncbi:MAG: glycosyltransferase family 4 protein [Nitrososphaerales archaeon]|jgi:glycosyltransferase involved in cell wall biosynthesis